MGIYGVVSDCHLGNMKRFGGKLVAGLNSRCREGLATLHRAVDAAEQAKCEALIIAGDLFDSDDVTGQVIAAAHRELSRTAMNVYVTVGNHDSSTPDVGDNACAPLDAAPGNVTVVDKPTVVTVGDASLLLMPFVKAAKRELLSNMQEAIGKSPCGVVVFHAGIVGKHTPEFLRDASDGVPEEQVEQFCARNGVTLALAGHWHQHYEWGAASRRADVVQIGALAPTGFDNAGVDGYGTLLVCEGGHFIEQHVIPGPRFLAVPPTVPPGGLAAHLRAAGGFDPQVARLYVSWEVDADAVIECSGEMALLSANHSQVEGEVLPCAARQKAAAEAAAGAASAGVTLDEALYEFVGALDLPAEVSPDDVLAKCRGYLGLG